MRIHKFFDAVNISTNPTSPAFQEPCGQDFRYLIQVSGTANGGELYIEESVDGVIWTSLINPADCREYFNLAILPIGIKDSYFMGRYMRLRIENGGTGNISAIMSYKTKV